MSYDVPVLALDGPSCSGKGTLAKIISKKLAWNYLDSGLLYRVIGFLAEKERISLCDGEKLRSLTLNMDLTFQKWAVLLSGKILDKDIRTEQAANRASKLATLSCVRESLLHWQRRCAKLPGLVADGRDIGTVVFPNACCKVFLTANIQKRAQRRLNQLRNHGLNVTIESVLKTLEERDNRDASRSISPVKLSNDAMCVDTTNLSINSLVKIVIDQLSVCLEKN